MAYYQKRINLFKLLNKIKLWPSRNGTLHGIRTMEVIGDRARITTHCNKTFDLVDSKRSRAARWLRNKWTKKYCDQCAIPAWKIEKYTETKFSKFHGSTLVDENK
ncbi:MAG: pyrrolysine--tRNA(Pyl) ligase small subunit [Desulfopila sp.]